MPNFTVADLKKSPDFNKLIVADIEAARKLEGETWIPHVTYLTVFYTTFADGEIHRVFGNGSEYREKSSIVGVSGSTSSWYLDLPAKTLYVHMPDGDSPSTLVGSEYKYCLVAKFMIGLSNRGISLTRYQNMIIDGGIEIWNSASDPTYWTEAIVGTAAVTREATEVYGADSAYSAKLTVSAPGSSITIHNSWSPGLGMMIILPSRKCLIRFKYKTCEGAALKLVFRDYLGTTCWLKEDGTWSASEYKIVIPASIVWTEWSLAFNAYATGDQWYRIMFICETNGDVAYIDNVEVRRYYEPDFFRPCLPANFPALRQSVGSFRDPADEISIGNLSMEDDGFFAYNFPRVLWDNRTINVLIGTPESTYDELARVFTGLIRDPRLKDGEISFSVSDARVEFKNLLVGTFDATTYPNCEDSWKLKPIPYLFGTVTKFRPPQQNTVGRVYRLSQTVFNSMTYALSAITAVYKNGALCTEGVDYTKDLNAGTITMLTGAVTDEILVTATGNLSNFVDLIYFVLTVIQGVPPDALNIKSLNNLKAKRVFMFARWYSEQQSIREFLDAWKLAAQFFFFLRSDGVYYARVLEQEGSPTYERPFFNEDLKEIEVRSATDQAYASVAVKYRNSSAINTERYAPNVESRPIWEREVRSEIGLDLVPWTSDADAAYLAGKYGDVFMAPPEIFSASLPAHALFLEPTDLIYLWKSVKDNDGTIRMLYSGTAFFVFEIEKDIAGGRAKITAYKALPAYSWSKTS